MSAQLNQSPYQIIKKRHITEKSSVLQGLAKAKGKRSLTRCSSPKYVFIVDKSANKAQIAQALEKIYAERNIKVMDVNTINVKGKAKRFRGRRTKTASFKKAIVTLEKGDSLE